MSAVALNRRTLSEQIRDALVARITDGVLAPGDRLIELKIAEEMQTSQAPVREAVQALAALGLVEMRRNRGAVVRGVDLAELRQIYEVRAALEGQAILKASPDVGAQLMALCDAMETAAAQEDRAGFTAGNDAFHRAIVDCAENEVLTETWERLDIRACTARNLMRSGRPLAHALKEHREIARLVVAGDVGKARDALLAHILAVTDEAAAPDATAS